jgi:hypothetical protein
MRIEDTMNNSQPPRPGRSFYAIAALLSFVLCISVLFYTGPFHQFIRNSIGDVLAVVFLYFLLGIIRPGSLVLRAIVTGLIACAIESVQLTGIVPHDAPMLVLLLFGSHFDPWDILAYFVGLIIAVAVDYGICVYRRSRRTPPSTASTLLPDHHK